MMKPDILVLTPTLGDRESLKRTVRSVKGIGGNKVKHILITPQRNVSKLQNQFYDIEVLAEPEDARGIYSALNYGFSKYGKGYKYLTFINDDDYWLPNFKELIAILDECPSLDFVYGKIQFVDESEMFLKHQACSFQFYNFLSLLQSRIVLFTQQATLLRSELFFQLGGFSEDFKLISDSKFWIDLSLIKPRFRYLNIICAAYTIQHSQLSSNKNLQSEEHSKLLSLYSPPPMWKIWKDKVVFRLFNLNVYLKRLYVW
jgi:glycosyltransferase involved in cell wall biosynthesis